MARVRTVLFILPLLFSTSLEEDTVAKDLGSHQLERMVELLTRQECEDLLSALSHPEEDIFQKLDQLSLENNKLDLQARVKRDTEVGKNINQDKSLNMKRYVEDYHKHIINLELPMVQTDDHCHVDQQPQARQDYIFSKDKRKFKN